MTEKKFLKLRAALYGCGFNFADVGAKLLLSEQAISDRMRGHCEWRLSEIYRVMEMIDEPIEHMGMYFPRDGEAPFHVRKARGTQRITEAFAPEQ